MIPPNNSLERTGDAATNAGGDGNQSSRIGM